MAADTFGHVLALVDVEVPIDRDFVTDLGLGPIHPGIGHVRQHLGSQVVFDRVAKAVVQRLGQRLIPAGLDQGRLCIQRKRDVLRIAQLAVGLRAAVAVAAYLGLGIAFAQRGEDRLLDRGGQLDPGRLGPPRHVVIEFGSIHIALIGIQAVKQRTDRCLLITARRFLPLDLGRMLTLLGDGQVAEGCLGIETRDTLRIGLKIEPQRTLDRHLEKAERLVGKDPGDDALLFLSVDHDGRGLAVPVVTVELGQCGNVVFTDLVAFVVQALLHPAEKAGAVDQLHRAFAFRNLPVGHEPDVGVDTGIVEKLVRQSDDGVQPVIFDDPAPDVGRAGPGIPAKERRTVEDDGDLGTLAPILRRGMALGEHLLQKQQRTVVDRRQARAETPREAEFTVLPLDNGLLVLPLDAEGRIGEHVMEALVGMAVLGLAVTERVAPDDVVGFSALDEHIGTANRPAFVVVLLSEQAEIGAGVLAPNVFLGDGEHSAGAAGRIINRAIDTGCVDIALAGIDQVRHQADHFARGEVVPGLLVGLLVEAHDQMLEQVAHLQVVDTVRVQVDIGYRLDDGIQKVIVVELLDLIGELEALEDRADILGETFDVDVQIGRDVLLVVQEPPEGVGADVVERLLAVRIGRLCKELLPCRVRLPSGAEAFVLRKHPILGRFKHAVEAAQHDDRQHHQPVLRRTIGAAEQIRDLPDLAGQLIVLGYIHTVVASTCAVVPGHSPYGEDYRTLPR